MTVTLSELAVAVFLAFCRVGACFMVMPGLSNAGIPMQVRLFMAVAASLALFMHLSDVILPFAGSAPVLLFPTIASELFTGALIGIIARLYMLALEFIGTAISQLIGINGIGASFSLESEPQPALGSLISFSALLLLFALDFHLQIVRALVVSYRVVPPDVFFNPQGALVDVADTISESFFMVLRLGSPFVAYAILVNFATGLVNKLAPQIPIYFISLPFIVAGGLFLLYFAVGTFLSLFMDGFVPTTIGR